MSIVAFLEGRKDFGKADLEKRDILALYRKEVYKRQYIPRLGGLYCQKRRFSQVKSREKHPKNAPIA